jgi:hypothetical protein
MYMAVTGLRDQHLTIGYLNLRLSYTTVVIKVMILQV